MKALLLSIFCTLVVVMFDSGMNRGWGATDFEAACAAATNRQQCLDTMLAIRARDTQNNNLETCKKAVADALKSRQELTDSCSEIASDSSTGESKNRCIEVAAACVNRTSAEQPSNMLSLFGMNFASQSPSLDFNSTCLNADLTLAQWEKKTEKAKSELEKKKEKLEKLQKESQEVLENNNKAKQKMEEKAHDLEEEFNKHQKQLEEAGEKEEAEASRQARESAARLREIVSKNLAMTQAKSVKLQERAAMLATMTDALIQTDCLEKIRKFVKEFNGSKSIISGGAGSALGASNTSGSTAQAKWQACLTAAYAQRDATLKKYQNEVQSIDQEMSNLNEEYKSAQKAIQEGEQTRIKAKTRREAEKVQSQSLYQQRRQKLMTDYMAALQEAQNKTQQLQSQLMTTQSDISKLSNELAALEAKQPGGDKTHRSAIKAAQSLKNLIESALDPCECASSDTEIKPASGNTDSQLAKQCGVLGTLQKTLKDTFDLKEYKDRVESGVDGD